MVEINRRTFLAQTSVGATALGLLLDGSTSQANADVSRAAVPQADAARGVSMMLQVRDVTTGEVALFVDHREVVFRDAHLVARLLNAAQRA